MLCSRCLGIGRCRRRPEVGKMTRQIHLPIVRYCFPQVRKVAWYRQEYPLPPVSILFLAKYTPSLSAAFEWPSRCNSCTNCRWVIQLEQAFPYFSIRMLICCCQPRRSAFEVADLSAATSSGTVHLIFLHLQRILNSARFRGHIVNTS